jgi:hypothetical protein
VALPAETSSKYELSWYNLKYSAAVVKL